MLLNYNLNLLILVNISLKAQKHQLIQFLKLKYTHLKIFPIFADNNLVIMNTRSESAESISQLAGAENFLRYKFLKEVNKVYSGQLGEMIEFDNSKIIDINVGFANDRYNSYGNNDIRFSAGVTCSATITGISEEKYNELFASTDHNISQTETDSRKVCISGHVTVILNMDEGDPDDFQKYRRDYNGDRGEWRTAGFEPPGSHSNLGVVIGYDSFWNITKDEGLIILYLDDRKDANLRTSDLSKFKLWLELLKGENSAYYLKEESFEGLSINTTEPARLSRIINKIY